MLTILTITFPGYMKEVSEKDEQGLFIRSSYQSVCICLGYVDKRIESVDHMFSLEMEHGYSISTIGRDEASITSTVLLIA